VGAALSETAHGKTPPNAALTKVNAHSPIPIVDIGLIIPLMAKLVETEISAMACVNFRTKSVAQPGDIVELLKTTAPHGSTKGGIGLE
jgi:hypothetical protein